MPCGSRDETQSRGRAPKSAIRRATPSGKPLSTPLRILERLSQRCPVGRDGSLRPRHVARAGLKKAPAKILSLPFAEVFSKGFSPPPPRFMTGNDALERAYVHAERHIASQHALTANLRCGPGTRRTATRGCGRCSTCGNCGRRRRSSSNPAVFRFILRTRNVSPSTIC